jgi:hypothetical protein
MLCHTKDYEIGGLLFVVMEEFVSPPARTS